MSTVDQGQSSIRAKQPPGFEARSCSALIEDWPCFLPVLHKEKDRNARFLPVERNRMSRHVFIQNNHCRTTCSNPDGFYEHTDCWHSTLISHMSHLSSMRKNLVT